MIVFIDFEGFLFLEKHFRVVFIFLYYNLGFILFLQKQAKLRLVLSPMLRGFMTLQNLANCNTSITNANELCFFCHAWNLASLCLGIKCLDIVWVQISRTYQLNEGQ